MLQGATRVLLGSIVPFPVVSVFFCVFCGFLGFVQKFYKRFTSSALRLVVQTKGLWGSLCVVQDMGFMLKLLFKG